MRTLSTLVQVRYRSSVRLAAQFRHLGGRHPSLWPLLPRLLCSMVMMALLLGVGDVGYWRAQLAQQDVALQTERRLRDEYRDKAAQAVHLEALRAQQRQLTLTVDQLQQQLPSKAEMAALLTDINQAGIGRGLQFEWFKPAQVVLRDYYAEQPIALRISGSYHAIGAFAGDLAHLPRIVTLQNLSLSSAKDGGLTLEAVAKTFRYLDPDELSAQRKAALDKKKAVKSS